MKRAMAPAVLAMFLILPASASQANVEHIIISAENALPGIWRFPPHPRLLSISRRREGIEISWDAVGPEKYCRIERARFLGYSLDCLEIAERSPRAWLSEGGDVHLSWDVWFGRIGCRWTYKGRLRSETEMAGHLGMECGDDYYEHPQPLIVRKMVLSEGAPDEQTAYLRRLLQEMARGKVTEPYDESLVYLADPTIKPMPKYIQRKLFEFLKPQALRTLGEVKAVVYIAGYAPTRGLSLSQRSPVFSETRSSVYAVEFANGERLCALHRRPDGVLDQFQCI